MMKKINIIILGYFLITLVIYWINPFGASNGLAEKLLYESYSIGILIAASAALWLFGFKGPRAQSLMLMLFGVLMWVLGDAVWNSYLYTNREIPFPSLGDYFYLIGYPALFLGLVREVVFARVSIKTLSWTARLGFVLFLLVFCGIFAYLGIYLTYSPDASVWENVVTIGYGFGDILLAISSLLLMLLIREYRGGKIATTWKYMTVGFVVTMLADMLYGKYTAAFESGEGFYSDLINTLYIIGLIFVFYAFCSFCRTLRQLQNKAILKK